MVKCSLSFIRDAVDRFSTYFYKQDNQATHAIEDLEFRIVTRHKPSDKLTFIEDHGYGLACYHRDEFLDFYQLDDGFRDIPSHQIFNTSHAQDFYNRMLYEWHLKKNGEEKTG